MEAGRRLLSPPPPHPNHPRTHHLRGSPLSSPSVPMLHDQARRVVTFVATTSIVRSFPASVLSQEQQDDCKTYYAIREENMAQVTLVRQRGLPFCKEKGKYELDQYMKYFEYCLLHQPGFCIPIPYTEEKPLLATHTETIVYHTNKVANIEPMLAEQSISKSVEPEDVLTLAKRAMIASRNAASLAEKSNILATEFDEFNFLGLDAHGSAKDILIKEQKTVRSRRLLERQSKKRNVPKKPNDVVYEVSSSMATDIRKKIDKSLQSNDPLRLFLWGPVTKQLLTVKEENDLFVQIQDLMRLEEIKQRLQVQFNREPTLVEWAQAVKMSCQVLQSRIYSGKRSREKMIYANFRLVVHVAKQYEGMGLNIQDLLQEGSRGLMKSLEKFKPKVGCRFPTYAYWWIRQSIRKSIFQNSRTIRLPENIFALLKRIKNARRLCIQEGHLPTNDEVAKRAGISVEKLVNLLLTTRNPVSIQDCAWLDQNTTIQEITADPEVEIPDLSIAKRMMRQHVRNLLRILTPRERQIIESRFGIRGDKPKSLAEIGAVLGVSKERVRQLESGALDKLKGCRPDQGLGAYAELLV